MAAPNFAEALARVSFVMCGRPLKVKSELRG
jgi:hypothetical protein